MILGYNKTKERSPTAILWAQGNRERTEGCASIQSICVGMVMFVNNGTC